MNIIVLKDEKEVSKKAAQIIKDVISKKEDAVLGLATGSSPIKI